MPTQKSEPASGPPSRRPHRSFLLRCWREGDDPQGGSLLWRFSIREVGDDPAEQALGTVGELVDFLIETLGES